MLGSLIKAANANLGKNQSKNSYDHNDPRVKNAQKKGRTENISAIGQQTGQIWTNRLTGPQPNRSDRAIIRAGRGVGELGGIGPNFL